VVLTSPRDQKARAYVVIIAQVDDKKPFRIASIFNQFSMRTIHTVWTYVVCRVPIGCQVTHGHGILLRSTELAMFSVFAQSFLDTGFKVCMNMEPRIGRSLSLFH
jgi:hypothetical protein